MKKRATRDAFIEATARATTILKTPKCIYETPTVITVNIIRTTHIQI
jgi:hypothetical protein